MLIPSVYEYDKRTYKELHLTEDIEGLKSFLEQSSFKNALNFGYDSLYTNHFVGSIKYKNWQLDIYPKYLAKQGGNGTQQLIRMLAYTRKLDIKISTADSGMAKGSFLEIIIWYYASSLLNGLRRHIPHHYRHQEENLHTVRGKIDFINDIRYNLANKAKIFCKYDEFITDNLLNRTLHFVSVLLYRRTINEETKQLFRSIFAFYEDLESKAVTFNEARTIRLSKLQRDAFDTPLKLAQLFLEHATFNLYNNTFKNVAILFDMNKLFEEFIFEKLREELGNSVSSQNGQRIITGFSPEEKGIDVHKYIRTDILIDTGDKESKIIIDTKYKNANKIASSDIYQMLAYGKIHNTKNLCLIYPKVDKEYSCNACFSPEIDAKLAVIAIDLSQELKNINVSEQIAKKFVLY